MREIKFRGKADNPDVDHFGEWIYGDLVHIGDEVFIQNDSSNKSASFRGRMNCR
jgi:hypothetical protein